jgi:hypothetical protein
VKPKLKILGPAVHRIVAQTEGVRRDGTGQAAFEYAFECVPDREGTLALGPFTLSMNGQELTSGVAFLEVLPPWDGTFGTFFHVDRDSICAGESFELVVETWASRPAHQSMRLTRSESFVCRMGPSRACGETGGRARLHYSRRSWLITPKTPGPFRVWEALFAEFPEDVPPPDLVVTVTEPNR